METLWTIIAVCVCVCLCVCMCVISRMLLWLQSFKLLQRSLLQSAAMASALEHCSEAWVADYQRVYSDNKADIHVYLWFLNSLSSSKKENREIWIHNYVLFVVASRTEMCSCPVSTGQSNVHTDHGIYRVCINQFPLNLVEGQRRNHSVLV